MSRTLQQSISSLLLRLLSEYRSVLSSGVVSPHTFPPLFKACADEARIDIGVAIHLHAIVLGFVNKQTVVSSALINLYAKAGQTRYARHVFDQMPCKVNVVPWTSIVAAYAQDGHVNNAFALFDEMRQSGIKPNSITLLSLLSGDAAVLEIQHVQCLHTIAFRMGLVFDVILANSLVNAYGKGGSLDCAWRLFEWIPCKDVVSWNSVISRYSRAGFVHVVFELFCRMRNEGMLPDHQTYTSLISSVANDKGEHKLIQSGRLLHAMSLTSGFGKDDHVETALISMYLSLKESNFAHQIFDRTLGRRDVVLWSAMVSGLVQNGAADKALMVFYQMLTIKLLPSTTALASALSACAQLGLLKVGASIQGFILKHNLPSNVALQNSFVTLYAKCGRVRQSLQLFEMIEDKDLVSWNAMVSGCAQNGYLSDTFFLFRKMILARQRPDTITVVTLLQMCAFMGALHHGKLVHNFIIRHGVKSSISLDTSLVDMYSKCGDLASALRCFSLMPEQDIVSWGAIIAGYGSHGKGETALEVYKDFLSKGFKPNDVIFLSVLSSCSHAGLVSEGLLTLKSMTEQYELQPSLEHWGCIIDLLCKAGRLEEALGLISIMSPRPNADIFGILLDACRVNGFISLAEEVARKITFLRPKTASSFVQLAHSYAAMRRWDGVGEARVQMKALGLKKVPAWSMIELNGIFTTFFAEHNSHSENEDIRFLLKILDFEMKGTNQQQKLSIWEF